MDTNTLEGRSATFNTLGIAPKILEIVTRLKLTTPTPVQEQAIPVCLRGEDVIGVAQTGTGKTLAFGIPLIQRLTENNASGAHLGGGQALILLPTRELAHQVFETLGAFGKPLHLNGALLIGGASMGPQIADLRRKPDVIVATPGRLIDHLEQGTLKLDAISILVLDEADRMLDMGFWPQIKRIIAALPKERQTMLFSATLSREIVDLATKHMKKPLSIEVSPPGTTSQNISQEFFLVRKDQKIQLLERLLGQYRGSTVVFTRTKHGATRVMKSVRRMGHESAEIHSNRSLSQRREALEGFKRGKYRILVATDIASRGIDVKGIELVINFDIPSQSEDYVHRIGRTARAGEKGHAISFVMPDEKRQLRDIERLIRKQVSLSPTPHDLPPLRPTAPHEAPAREEGPRRFQRRRR
ncbi:MAG TPA: DEAD/DEAH box helicase [Candidatus Paceibacterota bacterium]|nr:DEAD/DEAH box helicase [Candidatus Paceibacterota bacterium]